MRVSSVPVRAALLFVCILPLLTGLGGARAASAQDSNETIDRSLLQALRYRMVGPYRGGRSTAVTGHPSHPDTWLMGGSGGGVWRSDDSGTTWDNISDGTFGGSIGSIDIADSDPNVVYVGTGSADTRGNTSMGRGAWKSVDGGRTWSFIGLADAGQIGSIEAHPQNADVVFAAALGHPFGPNPDRGLYRSRDGGGTWEQVLSVSDRTGAMDVQFNLRNPREMYASMWTAERKPWTMISGSEESGIWKSVNEGTTWTELTDPALDNGLPTGVVGKIGLAVSPADPRRVWALIEAADPNGGVYRSDDGGASWERLNAERKLRQRAWYYTHLAAHPTDADTVFGINTRLYKSIDGGRTFEVIRVPHGDVHDLWINPEDPDRMIVADDGGAQVTVNGGRTWSTFYNQPTAELYDVAVDNAFPYRLYGGQQDNTGIGVPVWHDSNTLYAKMNWVNPGGCETGPIALHPDFPEITYGGCYGGAISRVDLARGEYRDVLTYPQLQAGQAGRDLRYRFQWAAPILVSRHDPEVVYHASNVVHRTSDRGFSWEVVSPDLTTDDPEHQDFSGGPIHHDITGVEMYGTIFSLAESATDPQELWAGSDDGRVHVTRDGGATWVDITPPGMPALGTVDEIELSTHAAGTAYVAVQRYRLDDFAPYVFRTQDWGTTWTLLTNGSNGIPADYPVRTVREDPERQGLLYAGTEHGVFVSFDDGAHWQSLQLNLPVTPVTGMRVHQGDLVLSTQGRSFWVLDDISPLRELAANVAETDTFLFGVRRAWRANMGGASGELAPEPPPQGATIYYALSSAAAAAAATTPIRLEILDGSGNVIRAYTSEVLEDEDAADRHPALPLEPGLNRFVWDLQHEAPEPFAGAVIWGYMGGPKAVPGSYQVRLSAGADSSTRPLTLQLDPRLDDVTPEQLQQQLELAVQIRDRMQAIFDTVHTLRDLRGQVAAAATRAVSSGAAESVRDAADAILAEANAIEAELIAVQAEGTQDLFNLQPMLASNYAQVYQHVNGPDGYIAGGSDRQPNEGAHERFAELEAQWDTLSRRVRQLLDPETRNFNARLQALGVAAVVPVVPAR